MSKEITLPSSPILIFGDYYLSKNYIIAVKKKYTEVRWLTFDASVESVDRIRMEAEALTFDSKPKILIIENLPNRKQIREFLINLSQTCSSNTKIIIWDSSNKIKVDPKTKTLNKTWSDFLKTIKKNPDSKIINNGDKLSNKNPSDSIAFVTKIFKKFNKKINNDVAKLVVYLIGNDRGFLLSDIEKMCLICPELVTADFIIEHAYPSSKESSLLKLSQALNTGEYENVVFIIEKFIKSGFNANELAVVMLRQSRWQMAAIYFKWRGYSLSDITDKLIRMGKFPAYLWHNPNNSYEAKKHQAEEYKDPEKMLEYLVRKNGIPRHYFKLNISKKTKTKRKKKSNKNDIVEKQKKENKKQKAEILPHPFVAELTAKFVEEKIINANKQEGIEDSKIINKAFDRSIAVYLFITNKLASIRYGKNPMQDLQEMAKVLTNTKLDIL